MGGIAPVGETTPVLYGAVPDRQVTVRLRLTPRSVIIAIALFGATLAGLAILAASERVIGWILAAAAIAGLLHPMVRFLARWMPSGAAVGLTAVVTVATVGFVAYTAVDSVAQELDNLRDAAPERAAELETSDRFGDFAREVDLANRTEDFVESIPQRLRGGTPAEALRAAATRGIAFLVTAVLTIFFLLHGADIAKSARDQLHNPEHRVRLQQVVVAGYERAFGYARGTLAMSALAGMLAFAAARAADVPGPAPLALWVAIWDVVPLLGAVIGTLPIIVLAAVDSPATAAVLVGLFIAYQLFEAVFLQRRLERRTIRLGPFLTVAAGFIGLELYGLGGTVMLLLVAALVVAIADEVAPE